MTEAQLEDRLRTVIRSEIRGFNPDPTDAVMGVLRDCELLPA